jgi:pteridine reductase
MARRCAVVQADLTQPAAWGEIIDAAIRALGSLDILVNNASIFERMTLKDFNVEDWDRMFRTNVTAVAGLSHHAAEHLARSGRGCIVNLADISADVPWSGHLAYCASKAAVVNLTRSLAKGLAPAVRVNAVAPGIAVFPEHYDEQLKATLIAKVPLKRPGTPEDMARAVAFLCTEADYMTGQILAVDGGRSIA